MPESGPVDLEYGLALAGDLVPQTRAVDVDEVLSHQPSSLASRSRQYMSDITGSTLAE
jgi:hypothetical protein